MEKRAYCYKCGSSEFVIGLFQDDVMVFTETDREILPEELVENTPLACKICEEDMDFDLLGKVIIVRY